MDVWLARYVPPGVKRRLPPGLRRFLYRSYLHLKATFSSERGLCPACGRRTGFAFQERNSEDVICPYCLSSSRMRHIARVALRFTGNADLRSLRDLALQADRDIYVTAARCSTASQLGVGKRVVLSEYWEGVPPGSLRDGVLCQDLQRLTFPDDSFDLVISECVFEHVVDYRSGFREVHRVLRPGGAHIFTIPYYPETKTLDRFAWKDGELVPTVPVEYHGDPLRGTIPAITSFGGDLPEILAEIGFETRIETADAAEIATYKTFGASATSGSFAFVSVKAG